MIKTIKEIINFFLKIEFVRFGMVGVLNTLVDYGLMNVFLFVFDIEKGIWFLVVKTFTITLAIMVSYFLNRSWTFRDKNNTREKFIKFVVLSGMVILVNVLVAFILVEKINVNFDKKLWANLASLIGAVFAIIVKYFGARRIFRAK